MLCLNKSDFINLKYLFVSTGLVKNQDIIDAKNVDDLLQQLIHHLAKIPSIEDPEDILKHVLNESLYYMKHYSYLHKNGICHLSYEENEWGINLTDESVLLIRLYQNLCSDDFFYVLDNFMGIKKEIFLNFQMDFNNLNTSEYIHKIYKWLHQQRNPFAENLRNLIGNRLGDIETKTESLSLNESFASSQGICLIINNENFQSFKYKQREGTIVDELAITDTFKKLNYDVLIYKDVKMENINKIVNIAKSLIKIEHRMFITFILSHGEERMFVTSDGEKIKFEDLWGNFIGSRCKTLIGKPKLFFFVCCQGSDYNKPVYVDEKKNDFSTIEFDSINSPCGHPDFADFFFGYATYKTFQSFRSTLKGTFYIKHLCELINQNPKRSINEIHVDVQGKLGSSKIKSEDTESFQMAYFENMLRESCCFEI